LKNQQKQNRETRSESKECKRKKQGRGRAGRSRRDQKIIISFKERSTGSIVHVPSNRASPSKENNRSRKNRNVRLAVEPVTRRLVEVRGQAKQANRKETWGAVAQEQNPKKRSLWIIDMAPRRIA